MTLTPEHWEDRLRREAEVVAALVKERDEALAEVERLRVHAAAASELIGHLLEGRTAYVTAKGRVLTDADIESFAVEAERGYDIEHLKEKPRRSARGGQ